LGGRGLQAAAQLRWPWPGPLTGRTCGRIVGAPSAAGPRPLDKTGSCGCIHGPPQPSWHSCFAGSLRSRPRESTASLAPGLTPHTAASSGASRAPPRGPRADSCSASPSLPGAEVMQAAASGVRPQGRAKAT